MLLRLRWAVALVALLTACSAASPAPTTTPVATPVAAPVGRSTTSPSMTPGPAPATTPTAEASVAPTRNPTAPSPTTIPTTAASFTSIPSATVVPSVGNTTSSATRTPVPPVTAAIWPVFDFDPGRTGTNPDERLIGPDNVGKLRVLWHQRLPDVADSSPVYRDGRLYLTLRGGGVVAVDARTGAQIWSRSTSGPKITNSSPALDPSGKWVYSYGLDGYVHKYNTSDGQEVRGGGWPVQITRLTPVEKGSSALNLANDRLYVTTSGYIGDQGHYDGHLVVVDLATGGATVFNSLCADIRSLLVDQPGEKNYCDSIQSGVWARAGAVVDPTTGNVFFTTGNGPWNGSTDWGDTVLELSGDGHSLIDTYTPTNQAELNDRDVDLGSAAPALLPEQPTSKTPFLAVQGGKDGLLRLLNRRNLSGQGRAGQLGGELQIVDAPGQCDVFAAPAVWTAPDRQTWLFVTTSCGLAGYTLTTDRNGRSSLVRRWQQSVGGTSSVIANGVLYVARQGTVDARDPATGRLLWSSVQSGPNGAIGDIHWESPIVVDGRLFISDNGGGLTAFGLPVG